MENTNKMLEFQRRVPSVLKDADNPFFKSKYADINSVLAVIKPILTEVGLTVSQAVQTEGGRNFLNTQVRDGSEIILTSNVLIPDYGTDVQKLGGALTYLRRYSLVALLALESEDDDGNTASQAPKTAPTKAKAQKPVYITPTEQAALKTLLNAKGKATTEALAKLPTLTSPEAAAWRAKLSDLPDDIQITEDDLPA